MNLSELIRRLIEFEEAGFGELPVCYLDYEMGYTLEVESISFTDPYPRAGNDPEQVILLD